MQTLLEPPAASAAVVMHHGCPLCGRVGHGLLYTLESGEIRRCGECGFVFARGLQAAESDEGYYDSVGGYERFVEAKADEWRELFRDLAERTQGRRLLEIGCARGYALALARESGWLPFGVETSAGDAAFARERFGLHVHRGTVDTCPFPSGAFDVIIMWSVIEHIADPLAALRACRRLIRPDGLLSIHTPNTGSAVAATLAANWKMLRMPGHVSFFGPGTMRMALRKCGFEVLRLGTGLGSSPVDIDPHARRKFSFRKAASTIVTRLGLKEPLREMIYAVQPRLREQGEFMAVLAKPTEE
ncbi:MAG TPA: class I SAM-dependent methyltransferase [Planctomycetota bacterium]|nr:class I SAM-dependent methyltransferase [Planctomycetota bacterium]